MQDLRRMIGDPRGDDRMRDREGRGDVDVVVIGSGVGGLCCAALLALHGRSVVVCESHTIAGGAAHGFERQGYHFDSGPSLYSGLSYRPSTNPLRHVLDAIGEDLDWLTYDAWDCHFPEGSFRAAVGADAFGEILQRLRGDRAVQEWRQLQATLAPLSEAAIAIPPLIGRADWGLLRTAAPYLGAMWPHLSQLANLSQSFERAIAGQVSDPFIRNWLNLLCFALSGLPASGTSAAEMAFMFAEWYRPGVQLDYPVGGSAALVNALVRGLERHGGRLRLGAHVEQILVERDRAVGVRLRGGEVLRSRRAVVSNATIWDTLPLLPRGVWPAGDRQRRAQTPTCASFMHLHLGIDAAGLPEDLALHHMLVKSWEVPIDAPQNIVLISIPSRLDPALAPPGHHAIHVYTPGNEPYDLWEDLDRRDPAYAVRKEARSQVMWEALERVIPDIRDRCQLTLVGTPLTHARFLRRYRGTYGPALAAGQAMFPGPKTPVAGLLCCGDSTFPGIGLPAVAASGAIAAHTLVPVDQHLALLRRLWPPQA